MINEEGVERRGPWRGERDPIPRYLDELKMLFFVKFTEFEWRPAEGAVPSAGRPLPPAPSALKPACELTQQIDVKGNVWHIECCVPCDSPRSFTKYSVSRLCAKYCVASVPRARSKRSQGQLSILEFLSPCASSK